MNLAAAPGEWLRELNLGSQCIEQGPRPEGVCACGCGLRTPLQAYTCRTRGLVKGAPMTFVPGHGRRRIAVDGWAVTTRISKWCLSCDTRKPLSQFRFMAHRGRHGAIAGYCRPCENLRLLKANRSALSYQHLLARSRRYWEAKRQDPYWLACRRERNRAYDQRRRDLLKAEQEAEAARFAKDPPVLALRDEAGVGLIAQAIGYCGSQAALEEHLGLALGTLNKYRSTRLMTFDLVDRLLIVIGEPQRLGEFDFAPRSARRPRRAQALAGGQR